MGVALLLAFIAFPLLEIALLIRTGQVIGLWPTIAVVVGTAFLGATLLRQQGFIDIQTSRRTSTRSDDQPFPGPAPRPDLGEGPVIEGEFERIDETTTRDPRR